MKSSRFFLVALASGFAAVAHVNAADPSVPTSVPDGLVMREGAVYFYKHGQPQKIENETRLSEGITVDRKGNVILKDGTKMQMEDGQLITLDGQVQRAPMEATPAGEAAEQQSESERNAEQNTSGTSGSGTTGSPIVGEVDRGNSKPGNVAGAGTTGTTGLNSSGASGTTSGPSGNTGNAGGQATVPGNDPQDQRK